MSNNGRQRFECAVCGRWFQSPAARNAHTCALTERFFAEAIPRWRAAGVYVHITPTSYDKEKRSK